MIIDLPWKGREVPCAILDIIRGCNARCAFCYNRDGSARKSLGEILDELAEFRRLRNLQAVMVSGGEPLLHPGVLDVIRAVRVKGLVPIVLTNGILVDAKMAAALKAAGCALCYLHIQTGQSRPDIVDGSDRAEVASLMRRKSELLVGAGIRVGCCVTLRADDRDGIARECAAYFSNRNLSNILVTTARSASDFDAASCPDMPIDELLSRFRRVGLEPFASLSGRIDKTKRRWFSFQVVEARRGDGTLLRRICLRASYGERLAMRLQRLVHGHYDFTLPPQSSLFLRLRLLLNALTGGRFSESFPMAFVPVKLFFRNLALDIPPYRRPDGRIEYCEDCPGAILKNGRLRPLCLSDLDVGEECTA